LLKDHSAPREFSQRALGSLGRMAQQQQAVQMSPLVGQAVAVVPGQQQDENPAAAKFYGRWSSDLFDCFNDCPICFFSFLCLPCYSCYQQSQLFPKRLGQLQLPFLGPVSGSQFANYAIMVFVIVGVAGAISRSMMKSQTQLIVIEGEPHQVTTMQHTPTSELLSFLAFLLDFFWLWLVYKGVAARFSIEEDGCTSFFKLLCCRCCAMTQIFRHVKDFSECNAGQQQQP